ncbi:MAG: tyrosinase family protein [Hyphomicrobiaceae bacterium]
MTVDRRTFVAAAGTIAAAAAVPIGSVWSGGATPGLRTRYDARSAEGKAMLRLYAKAVAKMRQSDVAGTPMDWTFQWYTHAVSGTTDKQAELDRIFPDPENPNRVLASLTWDTCEAHHPGTRRMNFLPWHRAYLIVFEEIVRLACADDSFTLPYWDYIADAVIPDEFRMQDDAEFGVLYVDRRIGEVNSGTAIDKISGVWQPGRFNQDALKEGDYLPDPSGVPPGFNAKLDSELHGFVHVNVGTGENMGSVPNAAYDPIFWLHHCNIDRLWAAWNEHGHTNPDSLVWRMESHVFADASGEPRTFENGALIDTAALGYHYDKLPPKPTADTPVAVASGPRAADEARAPQPGGPAEAAGASAGASRIIAQRQQAIELGDGPVSVKLPATEAARAEAFDPQAARAGRRRYLVVSGLRTNVQPGVLYDVLARGVKTGERGEATDQFVGSISFFDAPSREGAPGQEFVFDLTDKLRGKGPVDMTSFVIVPAGKPAADARPLLGELKLVER